MVRDSSFAPGLSAEQPSIPVARLGYLTPREASAFTGISIQELERRRREEDKPKFCYVGPRMIRYSVADLCDWLDSFKVSNTAEGMELHRKLAEGVANG